MNDNQARLAALDPTRSFIVQAPAGSGKTALLVYRMLSALSKVDRPENVLAITFTRKATAEMRERLLNLLKMAESGEESATSFEQQGIDLAYKVLERDNELGWQLLALPNQLQVMTIDAFCARLNGDMPWLSQLGEKPRAAEDGSHLYEAAVEALLNGLLDESKGELHAALTLVMLELDFNYATARRMFSSMLRNRDQWLRHLVRNNLADIRQPLEMAWRTLVDDCISQLISELGKSSLNQLITHATQCAQLIPQDKPQLTSFKSEPPTRISELSLAHWQELRSLLTTRGSSSFRKQININLGFPPDHKDRKKKFSLLLTQLSDNAELLAHLQTLAILPEPSYLNSDWDQLVALKLVLLRLAALLQLEFARSGECDHSEVTQRALRALTELQSPTDLALRVDYQLTHILVDEFQDTSRSQLDLLRQLTEGWQAEDGHSLFLVGDPMQSIYRFREADVGLFLQVANNENSRIFANLAIEPLLLSENFRSESNLVQWFNLVFAQSFPTRGNVLVGAVPYASSTSSRSNEGLIVTELVHTPDQEAQRAVKYVQSSLEASDSGTTAILVRSRGHLTHIIAALEANRIDFAGVDIKPLMDVSAAQDLITLASALCRPLDRLLWLALLRSPLVGLSLNELMSLNAGAIWPNLLKTTIKSNLLQRALPILESAMTQRHHVPLHKLTRWAWQSLGGMDLLDDLSHNDFERLLEVIADLEVAGDLLSISELNAALSTLFAKPATKPSTRVVLSTIHRAKGLQYETVIIPGLDRKPRAEDKQILMWAEHNTEAENPQLLLAPIRLAETEGGHFGYLRELNKQRNRQEMLRALYVACTRAKQRLILLAQHKKDKDGITSSPVVSSLLSTVWTQLESNFSIAAEANGTAASQNKLPEQVLRRLPSDYNIEVPASFDWLVESNTSANPSDNTLEFAWATELATAVGLVMHSWLETHSHHLSTIQISEHQRSRWRAQLRSLRVPDRRIGAGVTRLETAVSTMQSDPQTQFLFAQYPEAQNEFCN